MRLCKLTERAILRIDGPLLACEHRDNESNKLCDWITEGRGALTALGQELVVLEELESGIIVCARVLYEGKTCRLCYRRRDMTECEDSRRA